MNNVIGFLDRVSGTILPFLLKESLYAAVLFLLVLPLSFLLRKKSHRWQTGLWALVLLRLVLPPDLSFTFSARTALDRYVPVPPVTVPAVRTNTMIPSAEEGQVAETVPVPASVGVPQKRPFPWSAAALLAWLGGALFFAILVLRKRMRFQRIIRSTVPVADPALQDVLTSWRTRLGIRRPVRLVSGMQSISPFTMGMLHPVIYVPRDIVHRGSGDLIESVIAHECAHVKRLDAVWIDLQNLVQIVYFFHPAVWWANSRIHLARECICDQMVLTRGGMSPKSYGTGLLSVVRYTIKGRDRLTLLPAFGSEKKRLAARIRNLGRGMMMSRVRMLVLTAALIVLGALVLPMGLASDRQASLEMDAKGKNTFQQLNPEHENMSESNTTPSGWPVGSSVISSGFGMRIDPFTSKNSFHRGVDIPAPVGTPAEATAFGHVSETGCNDGEGNYVVINHGSYVTRYTHLDSILVESGRNVRRGDIIGTVGETGRTTAPHLHYEVRDSNDKPLDPEDFLRK
ncbi:peptidoglycan DD-metalloendopeptidase family protein [bacterium]|nr:peptidoglycan DD-metalloendopeptidase family protein [bacterium]